MTNHKIPDHQKTAKPQKRGLNCRKSQTFSKSSGATPGRQKERALWEKRRMEIIVRMKTAGNELRAASIVRSSNHGVVPDLQRECERWNDRIYVNLKNCRLLQVVALSLLLRLKLGLIKLHSLYFVNHIYYLMLNLSLCSEY